MMKNKKKIMVDFTAAHVRSSLSYSRDAAPGCGTEIGEIALCSRVKPMGKESRVRCGPDLSYSDG